MCESELASLLPGGAIEAPIDGGLGGDAMGEGMRNPNMLGRRVGPA